MNTTNLSINITHSADILKPDFIKSENAIAIYSPVNIKLRKRKDEWIDLKLNVEFEARNYSFWLKPSSVFACLGFDICDKENWFINKTKENTIMLHIYNRSFYYDIDIRKGDIIGFAFFVGDFLLDIKYKIKN